MQKFLSGTETQRRTGGIFHPILDFFCLGGASLLLLPIIGWALSSPDARPSIAVAMMIIANFINHPHFAYSYQLFYRNYWTKVSSPRYPMQLRLRYLFSGLIAPVLMAGYFAYAVLAQNTALLAYAFNAMGFLVGWHYVKQGYGIAIVESVYKGTFYSPREKRILLVNAFLCWIATWVYFNQAVSASQYWGLKTYTFALPAALNYATAVLAALSSAVLIASLLKKTLKVSPRSVPWNGITAYLASVYLWMMFVRVDPVMIFIVPALHSLQYLYIVFRYQSNWERSKQDAAQIPERLFDFVPLPTTASKRLVIFTLLGFLLGFAGFWAIPVVLDQIVPYDHTVFGNTLFIFVFWIFINVHHYFLDNATWQRQNPDVAAHLFSRV